MAHKYSADRLQNWYQHYNETYFANGLPKDLIVYMSDKYPNFGNLGQRKKFEKNDLGWYRRWGIVGSKKVVHEIILNIGLGLSADLVQIVLLHEMIHANILVGTHGPKFRKELHRLMNAGAFDVLFGA